MKKADIKEIVIRREDGTEETLGAHTVLIKIVDKKNISIDLVECTNYDTCSAACGMIEAIDKMGLRPALNAFIQMHSKDKQMNKEQYIDIVRFALNCMTELSQKDADYNLQADLQHYSAIVKREGIITLEEFWTICKEEGVI